MSGDTPVPARTHDASGHDDRSTLLARRVGPVVAAVGVLGGLGVLLWVLVAPDNVVGPVSTAEPVPATAVVGTDGDGCARIVEGDGTERELCLGDAVASQPLRWDGQGRLVSDGAGAPTVFDPVSGDVVQDRDDATADDRPGWSGTQDVIVDGAQVRDVGEDAADRDGDVLLDLGAPVGRLQGATTSPDGTWAIAVDEDGRVLAARTDEPTRVRVWFETDPDRWFDVWSQVRWDG